MNLVAGHRVTSSLELVRPLGAGGMGAVWVARHHGLKSDVVVKFVVGDHANDSDALARFAREAAAAAEVRSPHVVQVLDHGLSDDGVPYIAMELLEGEDLAWRVARQRVMTPGEVAGVVVQVARALARAHDKKIIHRDIKPENIFLCETGDEDCFVKVLDFGIAKMAAPEQLSGTRTGSMVGTPFYMSPEQIVGSKSLDHRTDLWSLGVVAFFALTGSRPFEADTMGGLALKICSGPIPRPSSRSARLSPAIDAWFLKACAREPADRFASAKVMAEALVAAAGGPAVARVPSRPLAASADEDDTLDVAGADAAAFRDRAPSSTLRAVRPDVSELSSTTGPSHLDDPPEPRQDIDARLAPRKRAFFVAAGAAAALLVGVVVFAAARGGSAQDATTVPIVAPRAEDTSLVVGPSASFERAQVTGEPSASATAAAPVASGSAKRRLKALAPLASNPTSRPTATGTTVAPPNATSGVAPTSTPSVAKPKSNEELLE